MARAHRMYWRFNLALIGTLMTLGFIVSFVLPLAAPALAEVRLGGFRLPFYFGAQGAILVYLALILIYIVLMQCADSRLQRAFDADTVANAEMRASAMARPDAAEPVIATPGLDARAQASTERNARPGSAASTRGH